MPRHLWIIPSIAFLLQCSTPFTVQHYPYQAQQISSIVLHTSRSFPLFVGQALHTALLEHAIPNIADSIVLANTTIPDTVMVLFQAGFDALLQWEITTDSTLTLSLKQLPTQNLIWKSVFISSLPLKHTANAISQTFVETLYESGILQPPESRLKE